MSAPLRQRAAAALGIEVAFVYFSRGGRANGDRVWLVGNGYRYKGLPYYAERADDGTVPPVGIGATMADAVADLEAQAAAPPAPEKNAFPTRK